MATGKEYLMFILDGLSELDSITYRMMMGEYIIYFRGKIAAYLCDNRMLVKPVPGALKLMPNASYEPPYQGAKKMLVVENTDDRDFLKELFYDMYEDLPQPKKKK